ncbi:inactive TPR repeat-containing thioredoxin TTL3-like [Phoenix dactylifera]|uniref:Inactive TPR repeat-containing thioredoxin TTL3-like n=1 Tax=Phoenix dactylifera TaxID=42345 RepID=A0A8B8ZZ46_PHODC|nr:inactive TPR repeat-containing thioredoxin TTL3-like [Phoenix dactylifera]XP_038975667.1 inactive TPR repeat-containing thioredoxin TTL3-like [Phoenix dactylifera]XP_038976553.1 inactive TPR repeat-containing thioredoxin TTL3-like [Phoenix dactylifera]XP_038976554.1 inactive TPR repeat-containing thioredoxin TTL3-like [Phoenix dactylifera]
MAIRAMDDAKKPSGCGVMVFYGDMFRRRGFWHRRSASTSSVPQRSPEHRIAKLPSSNGRPQQPASDDKAMVLPANLSQPPATKPASSSMPATPSPRKAAASRRQPESNKASTSVHSSNGLAAELDSMIYDHRRAKGSGNLVRVSSGNAMVYGNLGNIRGNQNSTNSRNRDVFDYLPKTAKESRLNATWRNDFSYPGTSGVMGNIMKNPAKEPVESQPELCRALSKRLDPEELKEMGNEEYKKGRFAEALALYHRAIVMNPEVASYWSNKAAALMGLGRLLEAVGECKEAVRIEPSYCRAHHRLGTLYLRLGEAEKAIHHYKLSRKETSSNDFSQVHALQTHLAKCNEARKQKDWLTVLKESQAAVSAGADSAPQVFALQEEALLKLLRHDDADSVLNGAPKFDIEASTKFYGAARNAYILIIRAQVDMALGRFEDAVVVARRASELDPSNREIGVVVRRTHAVASARSKGNDLFKASKYGEACIAYGEGLDHDPQNSVLLCNRAACRSKLGHWEKAIEDCDVALNVRPSYSKARLRRADCNAKMERWEASIKDYEVLVQEISGDEEVCRALFEAKAQLKKQRGQQVRTVQS